LPLNAGQVTLEQADWEVPARMTMGEGEIVPWLGGQTAQWRITGPRLAAQAG
jgi:dihydroorotase